jgi:hypothetical protein
MFSLLRKRYIALKPPSNLDQPISLLSRIWDVTDFKFRLGHPVSGLMSCGYVGLPRQLAGFYPEAGFDRFLRRPFQFTIHYPAI